MATEQQMRQFMAIMNNLPRQIALVAKNGQRTFLAEGDQVTFWIDEHSCIGMKVDRGQDEYAFGSGRLTVPGAQSGDSNIRPPSEVVVKVFAASTGLAFERVVDEDRRQVFIVGRKQ